MPPTNSLQATLKNILTSGLTPSGKLIAIAIILDGRQQTDAQLASRTGISVRQVQRLRKSIGQHTLIPKHHTIPPKQDQLKTVKAQLAQYQIDFPRTNAALEYDRWIDWMAAKNRRYVNYAAAFRNWLRKSSGNGTTPGFRRFLEE